jgi:hypothetical protein
MRSIKQCLVTLVATLFLAPAHSEVVIESYCLGTSMPKLIRLELRTYYDTVSKFSFAYVKYEKSGAPISLILRKTQSTIIDKSRPYELERVWTEVVDGKIIGEYEMNSQGAMINSFVYRNFQRKEEFNFLTLSSVDTSVETGCQW